MSRLAFGGAEGGSSLLDGIQTIATQPWELPCIGAPAGASHAESGEPISGRGSLVATGGAEGYYPLPSGAVFYARVKIRPEGLPPSGTVAYLLKFSHEAGGSRATAAAGVALRSDGRLIFKHEVDPGEGKRLPEGVSGQAVAVNEVKLIELGFVGVAATEEFPAHAALELRVNGIPQLTARDFGSTGSASVLYLPEAQDGGRIVYDDYAVNSGAGAANNSWCGNGTTGIGLPADPALGTVPPRGRNTFHAGGDEQAPLPVSASVDLASITPEGATGFAAAFPAAVIADSRSYGDATGTDPPTYTLSIEGGPPATRATWGGTIDTTSGGVENAVQDVHHEEFGFHTYRAPPHPEQARYGLGIPLSEQVDQFGNPGTGFYWGDPPDHRYWMGTGDPGYVEYPSSPYSFSNAWLPPQDDYLPPISEAGGGALVVGATSGDSTTACALYVMADFNVPYGFDLDGPVFGGSPPPSTVLVGGGGYPGVRRAGRRV